MAQSMTNDLAALEEIETSWKALEYAFLNNSPEVHSYLNLRTGDVVRHVDGSAEAAVQEQIASDDGYLKLEPVGGPAQFRWMEEFACDIDDEDARDDLLFALEGGKGVFRRFNEALQNLRVDADDDDDDSPRNWEQKYARFRDDRVRSVIENWLACRGLVAVERRSRPKMVHPQVRRGESPADRADRRAKLARRVSDISAGLSIPKLETLRAFAEFVSNRD